MEVDEQGRGMTDQVQTALADEKERLATALRSIGDGVIITDTQERITLFNAIAEQLTGWTQEQAIGKPLLQVFHIVNYKTREPSPDPARRNRVTSRKTSATPVALPLASRIGATLLEM